MNKNCLIGIDIGGTNTDAVLMDGDKNIIAVQKTPTTEALERGVETAIKHVLATSSIEANAIEGVFVGTTHATNAILERNHLFKVGVIRIAGQRPDSIPSCAFWPSDLRQAVFVGCEHIEGGFECDGRAITPFDRIQAKAAALKLRDLGAESIAVIGVFSPMNSDQELECAEAIQEVLGKQFPVSLSSEIGGIGFIERENGTVLNSALKKTMRKGFSDLDSVISRLGLICPLWITQNDGSIISLEQAMAHPILTISSGPTNSFMGAAKLSDLQDAIIVDIGGTSSDIGMICNGYPKRSMHNVQIGDVNLNFRMPDVLSIAIGGGSYVEAHDERNWEVSKRSCGKSLLQEAQMFGGKSLTLTDVACMAGCYEIPGGNKGLISMNEADAKRVIQCIQSKVQAGIRKMKGSKTNLPVIVVGGGAFLYQNETELCLSPSYFNIANAYGAALAAISATVDTVVSLENRAAALEKLKTESYHLALKKGADPQKTKIVDVSILPYPYLPNQLARVIVKAAGPRKREGQRRPL